MFARAPRREEISIKITKIRVPLMGCADEQRKALPIPVQCSQEHNRTAVSGLILVSGKKSLLKLGGKMYVYIYIIL